MYEIYADGVRIYNDSISLEEETLSSPILTIEDNSAGKLTMIVPPSNKGYGSINRLKSTITVFKDGSEFWEGRVISERMDFWKNRELTCEGAMAYLNDTIQPPAEYHNLTVREFLQALIDIHNSKVTNDKKFVVGEVTVRDGNDSLYRYTNYEKTIECINDKLISRFGGHMRVRLAGGIRYLDYYAEYPGKSEQTIEFGVNLVDYTSSWNNEDYATVVVPLGAQLEETPIDALTAYTTVAPANNGSIYVKSDEAVSEYGWIEKTIKFDDVTVPANLLSKAKKYLKDSQFDKVIINVNALDLHYLNANTSAINLLDEVRVVSIPHGMDRYFPVTRLNIPLDNPDQTVYTMGTDDKTSMTSVHNSTNSQMMSEIKALPSESDILKKAKENATSLINNHTTGYITLIQNSGGTDALIISDDPDYTKARRLWKFNINGLGYSDDGGQTFGLAMTMDGSIVADYITTGILNADLIKTGTITDPDENMLLKVDKGEILFQNGGQILFNNLEDEDRQVYIKSGGWIQARRLMLTDPFQTDPGWNVNVSGVTSNIQSFAYDIWGPPIHDYECWPVFGRLSVVNGGSHVEHDEEEPDNPDYDYAVVDSGDIQLKVAASNGKFIVDSGDGFTVNYWDENEEDWVKLFEVTPAKKPLTRTVTLSGHTFTFTNGLLTNYS